MTEATNKEFSACDMATAAAQGFRDGVASVRPAAAVAMPPSPYMPGVEPESLTDYERGEAQGRCDMWTEVARMNPAPDHSEHALGMVPADHVEHVRAMVVPDGWRLVPVEPTPEWVANLRKIRIDRMESVIEDVLAAAPAPEQPAKEVRP